MTMNVWVAQSITDDEDKRKGETQYKPAKGLEALPPGLYAVSNWPPPFVLTTQSMRDDVVMETVEVKAAMYQLRSFFAARDVYKRWGRAHKRGMLLYGIPGTGKTSILRLMANSVVKDGGYAFVSMAEGIESALTHLSVTAPEAPKILVVDEINKAEDDVRVLDLLDGKFSLDNVMVVGTTNERPEDLPPRFVRPGRFDLLVEIGLPGEETRTAFFEPLEASDLIAVTEGLVMSALNEAFVSIKILGMDQDTVLSVLRASASFGKVEDAPCSTSTE